MIMNITAKQRRKEKFMKKYIKQFMNVYWLRPESAVMRTLDAQLLDKMVIESPSLDFGSGDGIFSFIALGKGEFKRDFDVYLDINSKVALDDYFSGRVDIFDSNTAKSRDRVEKQSDVKIDYALDYKQNLLDRAKPLNFYNNFVCCDANRDDWAKQFGNDYFKTIFSNVLYWLSDPEKIIIEFKRILKPDGKIILFLPDKKFAECSIYNNLYVKTQNPDWKWLEHIDRGRKDHVFRNSKNFEKNFEDWEQIFINAELKIIEHKLSMSPDFTRIWDIGFRPLAPVLNNMVSKLNNADRLEIKEQWIDLFLKFAEPILNIESKATGGTFHYFILTK